MRSRIPPQEMSEALSDMVRRRLLDPDDSSILFYDLDRLDARLGSIDLAFPAGSLHAVAIKANPLAHLLCRLVAFGSGFGLEAASLPELHLARAVGAETSAIVFDSPAKTERELSEALRWGVAINLDSFHELERVARLREQSGSVASRTLGLRINPEVGTGSIAITSVAGKHSKFGIPISEREALLHAYRTVPWLNAVHLHIGSQGCAVEMLVEGVGRVYDLIAEVNRERPDNPVRTFDIGGGLPVAFDDRREVVTVEEYARQLAERCPDLFTPEFRLVTEFGRYLSANCGWAVSQVEHVRKDSEVATAVIHLGADMLLRECYQPDVWPHQVSVARPDGSLKEAPSRRQRLAGPLCFAGDIVGPPVDVPAIDPGDFVLIHDVGAYTFGMWSRYNSRQAPRVLGYSRGDDGSLEFEEIKPRESIESVLAFWGCTDRDR